MKNVKTSRCFDRGQQMNEKKTSKSASKSSGVTLLFASFPTDLNRCYAIALSLILCVFFSYFSMQINICSSLQTLTFENIFASLEFILCFSSSMFVMKFKIKQKHSMFVFEYEYQLSSNGTFTLTAHSRRH